MPGPKLGERIEAWFEGLPVVGSLATWVIAQQHRRKENAQRLNQIMNEAFKSGDYQKGILAAVWSAMNFILGDIPFVGQDLVDKSEERSVELDAFLADPSAYLAEKLGSVTSSAATREITESIGALVMDPVIALFESYAGREDQDPHEFARSFHGYMMSLSWAGNLIEAPLRLALGDRTPPIKDMLSQMYWTMGLGFLGWQTLAPLLSAGLQPPLERYYNKLYRPSRFTPGQASDLFALGEYTASEMEAYLKELGWRDTDIQTWIKLSYRTLSEGSLWDLYEAGTLSKVEMDRRLRAAGYDPKDLPLLYKSHEPEEKQEAKRFLLSTVKAAFKDGRMSETEFRAILTDQNYDPQIVDLMIEELTAVRAEEEKQLGEGNIKLLYGQRVIGRDEAVHYLDELGYTPEIARKLIDAWDNQALPKPARVNKSTILEGYTDGVLTRAEAGQLLQQEAGYTPDKAELLLKIEEAGRPEAKEAVSVAAASLSMLADWVASGLITRADLEDRAELRRFGDEDRERIVELMYVAPSAVVEAAQLDVGLLEAAYTFGAMTREDLTARLAARGLSAEDVELQIRVVELANPAVFGEFPAVLLKQPSAAAVQLAFQRGLIDEPGFRDRLAAQGYTPDAVEIFLFNAQYQLPVEPKKPTKADLTSWLKQDIINRAEFTRRMIEDGYLQTDIDLYLAATSQALEDTYVADLFVQGYLDASGFAALATEAGYGTDEIQAFLAQFV